MKIFYTGIDKLSTFLNLCDFISPFLVQNQQEFQGLQAFAFDSFRANLKLLHIRNKKCLKKIRMLIVENTRYITKDDIQLFNIKSTFISYMLKR